MSSFVLSEFSYGLSGFVTKFICFDVITLYFLVLTFVLAFCVVGLLP